MNQIPSLSLSYDEITELVITCIKQQGQSFEFKNFCNNVGAKAVRDGLVKNPNPIGYQAIYYPLQREDECIVRQVLWDLIVKRILTIGDFYNDMWPWVSVTEQGKAFLISKSDSIK